MIKTTLALLAVIALTVPTQAQTSIACGAAPPAWAMHEPSVPYRVIRMPQETMSHACHKLASGLVAPLLGCAYLHDNTPAHSALIILSDDLNDADTACVRQYEVAHLPPNNWSDPAMEAGAPDDPKLVGDHPAPWTNMRHSPDGATVVTDQSGGAITYRLQN